MSRRNRPCVCGSKCCEFARMLVQSRIAPDHPWNLYGGMTHLMKKRTDTGNAAALVEYVQRYFRRPGPSVASFYVASYHWPASLLATYPQTRTTPLPEATMRKHYGFFADVILNDTNCRVHGDLYLQAPAIPWQYIRNCLLTPGPEWILHTFGNPIFSSTRALTAVQEQLEGGAGMPGAPGGANQGQNLATPLGSFAAGGSTPGSPGLGGDRGATPEQATRDGSGRDPSIQATTPLGASASARDDTATGNTARDTVAAGAAAQGAAAERSTPGAAARGKREPWRLACVN
jgi:hypothetical protein